MAKRFFIYDGMIDKSMLTIEDEDIDKLTKTGHIKQALFDKRMNTFMCFSEEIPSIEKQKKTVIALTTIGICQLQSSSSHAQFYMNVVGIVPLCILPASHLVTAKFVTELNSKVANDFGFSIFKMDKFSVKSDSTVYSSKEIYVSKIDLTDKGFAKDLRTADSLSLLKEVLNDGFDTKIFQFN